jgi:predicted  nucleic acid-binding Zn-ribbon protein
MAFDTLFKSKVSEAADTVRQKLAAADAHLASLTAQQPALALEATLEQDGTSERLTAHEAQIATAEQNIRTLLLALQEAERLETERRRQVAVEKDASRIRALRQHLAALEKGGEAYQRSVSEMAQAWEAMQDASRRAGKLLLGSDREAAHALYPARLADLCVAELQRASYPQHPTMIKHPLPGSTMPLFWTVDEHSKKPTLSEAVANVCRGAIEETTGQVSDAP